MISQGSNDNPLVVVKMLAPLRSPGVPTGWAGEDCTGSEVLLCILPASPMAEGDKDWLVEGPRWAAPQLSLG